MKPGLFSTPRRRTLLLAAVAVLAALFFLPPRGPREPVYQGKTLTEWIKEADASTSDRPAPEARAALNAIGTNGVPFLLKNFTRPVSEWRQRFNAWAGKHRSLKFRLRDDRTLIDNAGIGLMHLRTNAAPAVPVVVRHLDDPLRGWAARMILFYAGDASLPPLTAAAASTNIHAVSNALLTLGMMAGGKGPALDALLAGLRHPDPGIRRTVVRSLARAATARANYLPHLVPLAQDPDPLVRAEVDGQLLRLIREGDSVIREGAAQARAVPSLRAPPAGPAVLE